MVLRRIDCIARRIRSADRAGRTITLRFRFDAFARATRSHSLPSPTAASATIESVAIALLAAALTMIDERGLTLLGASFGNPENESTVQMALLPD